MIADINESKEGQRWFELVQQVETSGGVQMVTMGSLRPLVDAERLGVQVLGAIEEKLRTYGLGHIPTALPNRQQERVILYRYGSPTHEVIRALQVGSPTEGTLHLLWRLNVTPDPRYVVPMAEVRRVAEDMVGLLSRDTDDDMVPSQRHHEAGGERG